MKVVIDHGITGATRAVARQDAIIIVDTIRAQQPMSMLSVKV